MQQLGYIAQQAYTITEMTLEHLFQPLGIGPTTIQCRVVSTSHQTTLVENHLPTEEFVAYQEARARGGVGLIILEAVAVARSGLLTAHTLGGYLDDMVDGYRRIVAAVRPHGTRTFVQLFHGGREMIASAPRPVVMSSSAIPSPRYHTEPRALRTREVEELISGYGRCARVAADAGLDGIEITAAHGYLGQQFFDPSMNSRTDRYREEARFLVEALGAVREAAPKLALGVRLSADSVAAQRVAPELVDHVDYVHLAIGDSSTFDGCTGIVPPPPSPRNLIAGLTRPFQLGRPLIATSRVIDPHDADRMIGTRQADAVGMNRALITDPDMPRKARDGRRFLRCIGCNACIAHYHAQTPIRCAQNPRTGRELTLPRPAPARDRLRLVVVGAGPAGLAAAAEGVAGGHEVILLERSHRVGGQVCLAANAPAHAELAASLLDNYAWLWDEPAVELRLNIDADAQLVEDLKPDRIVLATGAAPFSPPHRLEGIPTVSAWDLLAGTKPAKSVIVADWGGDWAGLDCAEMLNVAGVTVSLAVGAVTPGETLHQYQRNQYIGRLSRSGVTIEHYAALYEARDGEVRFRNIFAPELETTLRADMLAIALGRVPVDQLATEFAARRTRFVEAGDCRSPRGLEEAILEGTLAASQMVTGQTPAATIGA
jgi:2,4-dienoyl-CoA reductase-like NADH-dependent reductase (Old Yellow Enzyme family)